MKVIYKDISKKDLFDKLSKISQSDLKKLNLNNNEINYLKHKILNDKLGLVLNFEEKDEFLDNHYFGLEEVKELHINPKDKNNHLLIEGDNYYALKILQLSGIKVDVIYIDPPYNTGNKDFVYNDNFVEKDDQFKHSKWLSFMKKRLILARELLADDGVIFVSIDDNEQAYLKVLMDEIFGEQNFVSNLIWKARRGGGNDAKNVAIDHEYIIAYSKNKILTKLIGKLKKSDSFEFQDEYFNERGKYNIQQFDWASLTYTLSLDYPIEAPDGTFIYPGHVTKDEWCKRRDNKQSRNDWCWMMSEETFKKALENGFIVFEKTKDNLWNVRVKTYEKASYKKIDQNIERFTKLRSVLNDDFGTTRKGNKELEFLGLKHLFSYPKPKELIQNLMSYFNDNNILVLDFFAGSGTTGQAVMELNEEDGGNRRFILCTNNENNIAKDITRERIYRVINGEGSKGQKIDWQYSEDKKSLKNNSVKYLTVKSINKYDGQYEEIDNMKKIYKNEFNKELSIKDFK